MSDIALRGGAFGSMSPRGTGRVLGRIDAQTQVGIAQIDQAAELQSRRVDAIGYVGKRALHEVALLSQLEQQLSALVPMAAGRLQALGDMAALGMADVVSDTVRKVR